MLRYKVLLSSLLLSSSALASPFLDAFTAYGNKLEQCSQVARENTQTFPVNAWFRSLTAEDKINVLLFIEMDNRERCSEAERKKLLAVVGEAPTGQQGFVLEALKRPDYYQYVRSLDINEIRALQAKYSQPFDSMRVGKALGLAK